MTFFTRDAAYTLPAQLRTVDKAQLLGRICVSVPYFALETPSYASGQFQASAVADLPLGPDTGPMSSTELSRHAAIAGLCCAALAQSDDRRRFYLAQRAEYTKFQVAAPYGSRVTFTAQLSSLDKRSARASIAAKVGETPVALLEVDYTILTEHAFERLFRTRLRPTTPQPRMNAQLSGAATVEPDRAWLEVVEVPEAACAGHFRDYPALPVALLVGRLSELVASLVPSGRLRSMQVSVNATDLCWAGEQVRFEAQRAPAQTLGSETFDCQVIAEGRRVCNAEFNVVAF